MTEVTIDKPIRRAAVGILASLCATACYSSWPNAGAGSPDASDTAPDPAGDTWLDTSTDDGSGPDTWMDAYDMPADPIPDGTADPYPDPGPIPDVPPADFVPPDGWTGTLVPEDEEFFPSESGMEVEVHSGWLVPAAFSGDVYALIMDEDVPWATDDSFVAIYRLVPGGERLGTSWIDTEIDHSEWGTICWSGEVFVAALPTPGVGIRLLVVNEDGDLVRPVEVLGADAGYVPGAFGGAPVVLCPTDGPMVIDHPDSIGSRLYLLDRDGTVLPGFVTSDVSSFESNLWSVPCTEAGDEGVCVDRSGLVWVSRDGSYRYSDVLEDIDCMNGCDVAYTGTSVALAWTAASSGGKLHLVYARFGMDGSLEIPPVPGYPVGMGPLGVHAASSGGHVLVAAESSFAPDQSPQVHLLDLDGHTLDVPVPLTDRGLGWHWRGVAVFWEGDAYSALWNTWGGTTVGGTVAYRRFRVE